MTWLRRLWEWIFGTDPRREQLEATVYRLECRVAELDGRLRFAERRLPDYGGPR